MTINTTGSYNETGYEAIMQNPNGQVVAVNLQTGAISNIGLNPGAAWVAVTTGDFNDDGVDDILMRNPTTGAMSIWLRGHDNSLIGGGAITNPGTGWNAVASGDFNGDGFDDILLQKTDGTLSVWEMNGTNIIGGGQVAVNPGANWRVAGTIDNDNDGKADIVMQNTTNGQVSIWDMDGATIKSSGPVGSPTVSKLIGVGDGNVDELFFQNQTTGVEAQWQLTGRGITNAASLGATNYTLLGAGGSGGTTMINELGSGYGIPAGTLYINTPTGTALITGGAAGAHLVGTVLT